MCRIEYIPEVFRQPLSPLAVIEPDGHGGKYGPYLEKAPVLQAVQYGKGYKARRRQQPVLSEDIKAYSHQYTVHAVHSPHQARKHQAQASKDKEDLVFLKGRLYTPHGDEDKHKLEEHVVPKGLSPDMQPPAAAS